MLSWLKNLFKGGCNSQGCCGGGSCSVDSSTVDSKSVEGCCGGVCGSQQPIANSQQPTIDLGLSEKDKAQLRTIDPLVVVGKVLELRAHSNPDMTRVKVATIDLGGETKTILCAGTNLEAGQIVAVAKVESVLPGDFAIGEREMRGEVSQGMICASKELGLEREEPQKVIWPLPLDLEPFLGQSIAFFA